MKICIAGCGAVGSQVAFHIAHVDHEFLLIDDDSIEDHNVVSGTSIYSLYHVGMRKVVALAELLYRRAGCRSETYGRTLEVSTPIIRWEPDIVIDGFDNSTARALTTHLHNRRGNRIPTLHVGVNENRAGMVCWDERYTPPPPTYERGNNPVCTHALGRQILRFTSAVAAGVIERFIQTGEREDIIVTEKMSVFR